MAKLVHSVSLTPKVQISLKVSLSHFTPVGRELCTCTGQ